MATKQKKRKKYSMEEEGFDYRITALIDIPRHGIKKGDKGGLIAKESNLSHKGDCWVTEEAMASDNSRVYDNALVTGDSCVCDGAQVFENAIITDFAWIHEQAKVSSSVVVNKYIIIGGSRHVKENGWFFDQVDTHTSVFTRAQLRVKMEKFAQDTYGKSAKQALKDIYSDKVPDTLASSYLKCLDLLLEAGKVPKPKSKQTLIDREAGIRQKLLAKSYLTTKEKARFKAATELLRKLLPRVTEADFENLASVSKQIKDSTKDTLAIRKEYVG